VITTNSAVEKHFLLLKKALRSLHFIRASPYVSYGDFVSSQYLLVGTSRSGVECQAQGSIIFKFDLQTKLIVEDIRFWDPNDFEPCLKAVRQQMDQEQKQREEKADL